MTISDYRKRLDASKQALEQSILSKTRTDSVEELRYQKGFLDGVCAALRLIDEMENTDG